MKNITSSLAYSDLFSRYERSSDGKIRIAQALTDIFVEKKIENILDVGAGNGTIAEYIALKSNTHIECIEPNKNLFDEIVTSESLCKRNVSIQDFQSSNKYDAVLLSYVLESIDDDELNKILLKIHGYLNAHGSIYVVTYLPGTRWDLFTQTVASQLGRERKGGLSRLHFSLLPTDFYFTIAKQVETHIWGDDASRLYDNLAFFFKDKLVDYINNKERNLPFLMECSSLFKSKIATPLNELIIELHNIGDIS